MAEILYTDGRRETVSPDKPDGTFSAEFLRKVVGGHLDFVSLTPAKKRMVVNDNGIALGLPWNAKATTLYWENTRPNTNKIYGDVLVCDWEEIQ